MGDKAGWLDQSTFISRSHKATFNHPEFGKWITNVDTVIAGHDHPKIGKRNAVALNIAKYGRAVNYKCLIKEDLTGKKFGRYTVLKQHSSSPVRWLVRCSCGTENTQSTSKLKSATSCGCQRKEVIKKKSVIFNSRLIGNMYSKWTVIGTTTRPTYLSCKCECGTIREVYRNSLFDEVSTNCGCTTPIFKTEEICREIVERLTNAKWPKKRLFKNPLTNTHLELDGYCETLKAAFEYDGEQHFMESSFGSRDGTLKERQQRDTIKDQLCESGGIVLIRIPYIMKKSLESFILDELKKANLLNE